MANKLKEPTPDSEGHLITDVLVIGSGAGGLSAAISSRLGGLEVLVAEKADTLGGTTARSGGMMWVPCSSLARRAGVEDSIENARTYLQAVAGEMFNPSVVDAYLHHAPLMVDEYSAKTSCLRFVQSDFATDTLPHLPGARLSGRTVTMPPFDGRKLGDDLKHLAPPLKSLTFLGMMIQPGPELNHFFNVFRSWESFSFVATRLLERVRDAIFSGRTTRLVNGSGVAARLIKTARDLDITLWRSTPVIELVQENGRVTGAVVTREGKPQVIRARCGVVVATGGFPHDRERRRTLSPVYPEGAGACALAATQNVGDGLRMAEQVGAKVEDRLFNTISWTPVSRMPGTDSPHGLFPHGFDCPKPGFIAVTRKGKRFCNEATVGNDFIRAMVAACGEGSVEGFLLCDHHALRKYGMGMVPPAPIPVGSFLRKGYLLRGKTLADLAEVAGIDGDALKQTVERFNLQALAGKDPEFGRGDSALDRRKGDPDHSPNPSLGPLLKPPFYAVKLYPGDYSTLAGLRVDEHARVLDAQDKPIPGLYAAGNDLNTMGGGYSPAGGFTLGPAMTFGFIAGRHLSKQEAP